MANETMYFILSLVEATRTIHIIIVTLLHIVHLVTKVLLLWSPSASFAWSHPIHTPAPHTSTTAIGQAKA
jgi:hypothetical protein